MDDCQKVTCSLNEAELKDFAVIQDAGKKSRQPLFKTSVEMGTELYLLKPNDAVWINLSVLSQSKLSSHFYDIPKAISLWIQILASTAPKPLATAQSIAQKAQVSFSFFIQRGLLDFDADNSFEFLVWKNKNDQLFLRDATLSFIELSGQFNKSILNCSGAISDLKIYSPAWFPLKYNQGNEVPLTLRFGLSWLCDQVFYSTNGFVFVTATRASNQHLFAFDINSLEIFLNTIGNK